jgi:hypothetical protein
MFKFHMCQQVVILSKCYPNIGHVFGRAEFDDREPSYLILIEHNGGYCEKEWFSESLLNPLAKNPDLATYKEI